MVLRGRSFKAAWPATYCTYAAMGKYLKMQQESPVETAARASTFKCQCAQACTDSSAVPAAKICNRALADRLLLAGALRQLCKVMFQIVESRLVRATGWLSSQDVNRASRASTRVQLESRTWHRSNSTLQGALRGFKQGESQIAKQSPNGSQIASALSAELHAMSQ